MTAHLDPAYRRALVASAALNAITFFVEGGMGLAIHSSALLADAVDFLEDAGIYSLGVIALGWSLRSRATVGLAMGVAMAAVGLVALGQAIVLMVYGGAPPPAPMAATAAVALAVNVYCAFRLVRFKRGDASMRSIWLSTRNDAILNGLTIVAAGLVYWTGTGWPDILAGFTIAAINLWAAGEIVGHALKERRLATQRLRSP